MSSAAAFTLAAASYPGGPNGFELVLDLLEDAAVGLLEDIQQKQ